MRAGFCSVQKDDLLVEKFVIKDQISLPQFHSPEIWRWSCVVIAFIALSESEGAMKRHRMRRRPLPLLHDRFRVFRDHGCDGCRRRR